MTTNKADKKKKGFLRRHPILTAIICALIILAILSWVSLYQSKHGLTVSRYEISADTTSSFEEAASSGDSVNTSNNALRIVQISDLHNSVFGENNKKLIDCVADEEPDLILMTGDLVNAKESETTIATDLIRRLTAIAPVYVSMGNHEVAHEQNFGDDLTALWEEAGAVVLDGDFLDIDVEGKALRIGGIYGYCLPGSLLKTGEARANECEFLEAMQATDRYTILMCHMPVCWIVNDSLEAWDIDCVFAGHAHGGEVILPVVGGLYASDFGWFPGKLEGLFYEEVEKSEDGTADRSVLVLSRGLGTAQRIPRFNNVPEVVSVTIAF